MIFVAVLEPEMSGARDVVDLEIQPIDGAEREAEVFIVWSKELLRHLHEPSRPITTRNGEVPPEVLAAAHKPFEVCILVEVAAVARAQVPAQVTQRSWFVAKPITYGHLGDFARRGLQTDPTDVPTAVRMFLNAAPLMARLVIVRPAGREHSVSLQQRLSQWR